MISVGEQLQNLMTACRARAKADAKSKKTALADLSVYSAFRAKGETVFLGYDALEAETNILGIIVDGVSVDRAVAGDIAEVMVAAADERISDEELQAAVDRMTQLALMTVAEDH